ncbi:CAAX prenyl protease [Coemansia brasiliensis]|uniref:intramembrane prenyl-peptidase Rce1 n=1 Tax=Coemansia brasiliensis TaxID=2650707 RepID=A0A9W8IFB2_9FUNG|nr:CAAX prenyl protease [Coemansia brasiliensis]
MSEVLGLLGLNFRLALPSMLVSLVLINVLFLGPLVMSYMEGEMFASWEQICRIPQSLWKQPVWMRNYLVGPLTEELVFRSSIIPLWTASHMNPQLCIWVSPTIFGIAHVHQAVSRIIRREDKVKFILLSTLAQFMYTTVFGWIAAALFVRTKSVVGPVVAHVFCNVQGFPDFQKAVSYPRYLVWLAFLMGLLGFLVLFEPMTRPGVFIPE